MFTNYPLAVQMLGWAVFMGLNGYIGATCPLLNLAVLAFLGAFASKKIGIILLIIALIITAAEFVWTWLVGFAAGMSATPIPTNTPSFMEQGTGILNLVAAGVVFFVLLDQFYSVLPAPKWLAVVIVSLFYIIGAWSGVNFWLVSLVSSILLVAVGLLIALCYTRTAPYAIGMGAVLFLGLAAMYGSGFVRWCHGAWAAKQQGMAQEQFMQAVTNNEPEQIAKLYNSVDSDTAETALRKALAAKNEDMVRLLIKQGVWTGGAMKEMIYDKKFWAVQLLVNAGAPITSWHVSMAADENFMPAVQLFVEKGVNINQKDERPLTKASESGNLEIVQYLLKTGKNSQGTLNDALWALCDARPKPDTLKIAQLLLDSGAQVNSQAGFYNTTPLHGAAQNGSLGLVKLLVSKGAKVNAVDKEFSMPLAKAVQADNLEIAKFLLEHGADKTINHSDDEFQTAIFKARSAKMAQLLIANGANVSESDKKGLSVLLHAVANYLDFDLLKVLLQNGADINARDKSGTTALLWVAQHPYERDDKNCVQFLLENGAKANVANNQGETPLLVAEKLEVLQALLAHGADVNAQNEDGQTALIHIAQIYDPQGEKTKGLLEHGADVNIRDKKGKTALGYATAVHSGWYSKEKVEILKQYGAKK